MFPFLRDARHFPLIFEVQLAPCIPCRISLVNNASSWPFVLSLSVVIYLKQCNDSNPETCNTTAQVDLVYNQGLRSRTWIVGTQHT